MDLKALARELHADERAELLAHLLALGAEDRRLRFEYSMSDDGVRRYVEGIDFCMTLSSSSRMPISRLSARPISRAKTGMRNLECRFCHKAGVVGSARRCSNAARRGPVTGVFA